MKYCFVGQTQSPVKVLIDIVGREQSVHKYCDVQLEHPVGHPMNLNIEWLPVHVERMGL